MRHPPSHRDAQRQHQRLDLLPEHPGGSDGGHSDVVQKWLGNGNPKLPQQDRSWHCIHGWAFPDRRWPESSKVDCTRRTGQVTGKRISVQDSERTMFSARIGHMAVESPMVRTASSPYPGAPLPLQGSTEAAISQLQNGGVFG